MEFWRQLARISPIPIFFFYGRWYLPLPYKRPVITVIGRPIETRKLINRPPGTVYPIDPTPEEMEVVYNAFKEELRRIYDTYKPSWETRPLVIIDAPPVRKAIKVKAVEAQQGPQPSQ